MEPDELKEAWKRQAAPRRLAIDADQLLREVRRNQDHFRHTLFWRDLREAGGGLLMAVILGCCAIRAEDSSLYVLALSALWIGVFILVDRWGRRRGPAPHAEPLIACIHGSLGQVTHQVWLLRNVLWWYLLPPSLALTLLYGRTAWAARGDAGGLCILGGLFGGTALLYAGVYWLNQYAVRKSLEPRRQELLALLSSLQADAPDGAAVPAPPAPAPAYSARKVALQAGLICAAVAALTWLAMPLARSLLGNGAAPADTGACPAAGDAAITNFLVQVRQQHRVPAIAAALVTSRGLVSAGVAGTRKSATDVAATLNDQWHLGSDTKAMTATLLAKLVEQGRLGWNTTLADVFPDLAPRFAADTKTITVLQLLSHRSGLPSNPDLARYGGTDGRRERLRLLEEELRRPLAHPPGTHFEYSNLGYSLAGAIAERITGKTWEQAMREEVFSPLGMAGVGFGGTGTPGQLDQPWGHDADGQPVSGNGPAMDNPPVLSPAGRVHCTMQDWARFIADQLRGARGEPALLKAESYQKLHTPPFGGDYALGWLAVDRPWGGGRVLNHGGDNTMNFANVWVAPKRDFAVLVCVNQSGNKAFQATDEVVGKLIALHERDTK